MSLTPGSHVGPYEVLAPLGEGAMGVVYRARDVRLQRDVALKLLPDHFAKEPDRLSRFQREAQVLASLNHANIAQIYGLESANGSTCIVMELVEGETLEDRIKQGPIPYDETIHIVRQLSDALAAAHERGIVHRDLKPANIKLTPQGNVKVLDFGLAKAISQSSADTHLSVMPTMAGGSIVGAIVGTPGYMSPEQARGKEVDARTDIWAFGCIVYEMLTGQQAFSGETITDVMAKIVTSSPDLELLAKSTPISMRLLLQSALNKSASQRLQHIGDSRLFLDGTLAPEIMKAAAASPARQGLRGRLLIAALIIALVVVAVPAALYFRETPSSPAMHLEISFPPMSGQPMISPDGKYFLYGSADSEGKPSLWLRPMNSDTGQQITGTENVSAALWSGDSQRILFMAEGKLKKIPLAGGAAQVLGAIPVGIGGDWKGSGDILVARADGIIVRIPENGGEPIPVTKLDTEKEETIHALPRFLPDGKKFVYISGGKKPEESGIYLSSIDASTVPRRILAIRPNRLNAMFYVPPGYLVFQNNGAIMALRVDDNGNPQGEPATLADDIEGTFSVSNTGILLYRKATTPTGKQLVWFDREGNRIRDVGAVANYGNVDISPKGDRAAVDMIANDNRDIWVMDLARGVPLRITFDAGNDWTASWSPDGTRIAFGSTRATKTQIYEKSATGSGAETVLSPDESSAIPVNWSPDNKYIVFSRPKQLGQNARIYDTWLMPVSGEHKGIPYLETSFDKSHARVSPDGRWIAYATNESGMYQIVVQTFPDSNGGKWPISAQGGTEPKWRRDGGELYYLAFDGKLMAVPVSGPAFVAGQPVALFQTPLKVNRSQPPRDRRYDVSPDGRFLVVVPETASSPSSMTVVVNWPAALGK